MNINELNQKIENIESRLRDWVYLESSGSIAYDDLFKLSEEILTEKEKLNNGEVDADLSDVAPNLLEALDRLDSIQKRINEEIISRTKTAKTLPYCKILEQNVKQNIATMEVLIKAKSSDRFIAKLSEMSELEAEIVATLSAVEKDEKEREKAGYKDFSHTVSKTVLQNALDEWQEIKSQLPEQYRNRETTKDTIEQPIIEDKPIDINAEIRQITLEVNEIYSNFRNNNAKSESDKPEEEISIKLAELKKISSLKERMLKLASATKDDFIKIGVLDQLEKIEKVETKVSESAKTISETLGSNVKLSAESSRIIMEISQKLSAIGILRAAGKAAAITEDEISARIKELKRLEKELSDIKEKLQKELQETKSEENQKAINSILKNIGNSENSLKDFKKSELSRKTLETISLEELDEIDLENALRLFGLKEGFDRNALEERNSELLSKYDAYDTEGTEEFEKAKETEQKIGKLRAKLLEELKQRQAKEHYDNLTFDSMTEEDLQKIKDDNDIKTALHLYGLEENYTEEELKAKKEELFIKYRQNTKLTPDQRSSIIDNILAINDILEIELSKKQSIEQQNNTNNGNTAVDNQDIETLNSEDSLEDEMPVKVVASRVWNYVKDHKKQILIGIGIAALLTVSFISLYNLGIVAQMAANGSAWFTTEVAKREALHVANSQLAEKLLFISHSFEQINGVWTIGGQKLLTGKLINTLSGISLATGALGVSGLVLTNLIKKRSQAYKEIKNEIRVLNSDINIELIRPSSISNAEERFKDLVNKINNSTELSKDEQKILLTKLKNVEKNRLRFVGRNQEPDELDLEGRSRA